MKIFAAGFAAMVFLLLGWGGARAADVTLTPLSSPGSNSGAKLVATLDKIMERKGRPAEARLKNEKEEFITVAKYLFAVDTEFRMG